MGGALLYLNVNQALRLSADQLLQSRTMTVADSHFDANPGVLCLIASNGFLKSSFRNNSLVDVRTAFIIKQLAADLTIHACSFHLTHFLVVVSALLAQLTVSEVSFEGIHWVLRYSSLTERTSH